MFSEQDKELIAELNLARLSEEQQAAQLQKFYQTLQMRIGMALEDKLSDEQLEEFEAVSTGGDDEAVYSWLHKAIPDYDQVVAQEMESLKQEIKQNAADYRAILNGDDSQ